MRLSIREYRLIRGLNQKEFADKIGMSKYTYQSKESGKRPWKANEIKEIAKFLNVSIESELIY